MERLTTNVPGILTASSGARYLASRGFSPSSATWASACRQASSGTLPDPTLCPKTTWLLESLPNIGGWTLPGLKVVLPDGTVLLVKPVKSMASECTTSAATTATATWLELLI